MARLTRLLDREDEMAKLDRAWEQAAHERPQLVVMWGRRRVGKTFLLSHFTQHRRAVFFGATQQAETVELARLVDATRRDLGDRVADLAGGHFASWEAALRFFAALASEEPLVVVLDEVPYLAGSTQGFASVVQAVWDHLPAENKLMLVLTGSAIAMMETMVGAGGALRGRPTLTIKLGPLGPLEAHAFLPRLKPAAFIEAYAACGGYPLHLREWDETATTETNLVRLAATPGGILLEDAAGMLAEELPQAGGYARILAAIGRGRTRFGEIAAESEQRVERPLEILTRAGLIAKVTPVGAPKGARASYEIADPYMAFWFSVLYSDISQIGAGQGTAVIHRSRAEWQRRLGAVFEDTARAHAARLVVSGTLPEDTVVGRWWAIRGESCEIDVLGLRGSRTVLLGEARWQRGALGRRDLEQLKRKTARAPRPIEEPTYALWGRGGVERGVAQENVLAFGPEEMLTR
ncbi:MAG TPA: ATP-binding protein [Solirubrobacteraceae bacterium]|nr:ATP-binding protein [Solirubrobacteraceae bacterium]